MKWVGIPFFSNKRAVDIAQLRLFWRVQVTAVTLMAVLFVPSVSAMACYDVPKSLRSADRFMLIDDEIVRDGQTGLIWMRCAVGQYWKASACYGPVHTYEFWDAQIFAEQASDGGWRIPTLAELSTLIEPRCFDPAINARIFPNMPSTGFWSSTEDAHYRQGAWLVHFLGGDAYMGNKSVAWAIRLVRGND